MYISRTDESIRIHCFDEFSGGGTNANNKNVFSNRRYAYFRMNIQHNMCPLPFIELKLHYNTF